MFDNKKIRYLRTLPEGNNIVLIWVMLLTMAGRCNAGGMIFLTENIPYTPKMLADELGFDENIVTVALSALNQLGMIRCNAEEFVISNWEEYQNVEGLDKIREQNRIRKANQRSREKQALIEAQSRDSHVTSQQSHATDIDKDIDKEIDIDKENILSSKPDYARIIGYLNEKTEKSFRANTKAYQSCINARYKEGFREEDFFKVVDIMVTKWGNDPKMSEYLRPQTLFGTKMESYLQSQPYKDPHKVDRKYGDNGLKEEVIDW